MTKYTTTSAELSCSIQKGRYYGVMVDMPISWKGYTFAAFLRVGSTFTPMEMNILEELPDFTRYKIEMNSIQTANIKGSGECEIQISIVDAFGEVYDILTLETHLESSKPHIHGGNNA